MNARQTNGEGHLYDVAILGTGLAGSTLGAVLARHGVDVLLIDAGAHPRFAIGESTIPYTSTLMRVVAARYDVPEIKRLATFESVRSHVTTGCGVKRNFGFVYHQQGRPQDPKEATQFVIPKALHTENHFFRQHIDAWMLSVAIHYGASVRQQTRIEEIDIDEREARLGSVKGEEFRARFLVDASGHASPVAKHFKLREDPPRFRHHSRSLFTHMVGVKPYDEVGGDRKAYGNPSPWHQGTLHHLFDGGWMWVIPFNNHRRATNPVCSVGLSFDTRRFPRPEGDPEAEFRAFVAQYPEMAGQFTHARAVRPWVSTDRLQYSSSATVGHRYCLTSHAAGFLDALFSRGLTNSLEIINALAARLIDATRDDDFSVERFKYVEELEQGLLAFNDDLVDSAYTSFRDFHMWNATFRVWSLGAVLGTFELQRAYADFVKRGDPQVFWDLERARMHGMAVRAEGRFEALMDETARISQAVAKGEMEAHDAGDHIFGRLATADFVPPAFGFQDPDERYFHATPAKMARTFLWARNKAPEDAGRLVEDALKGFAANRLKKGEFHMAEELKGVLNPGLRSKLAPDVQQ